MIRITPAGALTATSYPLTYEIVEKLCRCYGVSQAQAPVVNVAVSVADQQIVGGVVYATIQAVVNVNYQPRGKHCPCSYQTNTFVEKFVVSGAGTAVSVSTTPGYNEPAYVNLNNGNVAQGIRAVGEIAVTITPAG